MTKGLLISFAVGVIALGGITYVATQGTSKEATQSKEIAQSSNETYTSVEELMTGDGNIADLLRLGKSIQCTFSYTPEEFEGIFSGKIYIGENKVRADMQMDSSFGDIRTSVIQADGKGYMWSKTPMGETAVVFDVSEEGQFGGSDESIQQAFNADTKISYECSPWSVDASKFVPPSDIEFLDVQTQIETSIHSGQTSIRTQQCGACAQIPDESAKAQCLQVLQCE